MGGISKSFSSIILNATINSKKELCMLCNKLIYKHQHVAVCCVDGRIYHGACLGFDKDSCFHIHSRSLPNWFCPMCAGDIFPLYDDIAETSNVSCLCANCKLS